MRKLLFLALLVPACVVGEGGSTPTPGDDDTTPPDPDPTDGVSGHIAADQTWTGQINVTGQTTIDPGVTVTVMPGTIVSFAAVANLSVQGSLVAHGAKGQEIQLKPATGATFYGAVGVGSGGSIDYSYVIQTGGGISTGPNATATIIDSKMFGSSGDFLVMSGGKVTMSYSQLGADPGTADTIHCNMHFGGSGNMISITHSNIEGSPYGLMFYGGQGADFTFNNWEQNATASQNWIDSQSGVSGDFSNGFFSGGPPTPVGGAQLTVNTPSATRLTDAGVR